MKRRPQWAVDSEEKQRRRDSFGLRVCLKSGFVVTTRQYGEFVGHEWYPTWAAMLDQFKDFREAGITSVQVVGIRHRGRYLSPEALAFVLDESQGAARDT